MPRSRMTSRKMPRGSPLSASVIKELRDLRLEVAQLPRFNKKWKFTHDALPVILETRYRFARALEKAHRIAVKKEPGYTVERMAEEIGGISDEEIYFHLDLLKYCAKDMQRFILENMAWYRICREVLRPRREKDPERFRTTSRPAPFTGELIRKMRERLGLSRTELAELVGLTSQSVHLWEGKGKNRLTFRGDTEARLIEIRRLTRREVGEQLAGLSGGPV